ncbi:MAG: hypothetical protein WCH31_00420 [Actinomycetes bacterium]
MKMVFRVIAAGALAAAALALAAGGQARNGASLSIVVTFTPTGTISVALPDGTPLGTTSGAPTVIPAGYYTIVLYGPGECIQLPLWELTGPGVNVQDNMHGGEVDTHSLPMTFQPSSTYTWHSDRNQAVVYTFKTSADTTGTKPPASSSATPTSSSGAASTDSPVGSSLLHFQGTLAGSVSAAGKLTLSFKGMTVRKLAAGRYVLTVTDQSKAAAFLLRKAKRTVTVTGEAFTGKRSATVSLTAGTWAVSPRAGATAYSIRVG